MIKITNAKKWSHWAIGAILVVFFETNLQHTLQEYGYDSLLSHSFAAYAPQIYPFVVHPLTLYVVTIMVSIWIGFWIGNRQKNKRVSLARSIPHFSSAEHIRPINDEIATSLFTAVERIRQKLSQNGLMKPSLRRLSRDQQINQIAKLIHQKTTVYGILPPSLESEPVPSPGEMPLDFVTNGTQLDSQESVSKKPSYRFLHIETQSYPLLEAEIISSH